MFSKFIVSKSFFDLKRKKIFFRKNFPEKLKFSGKFLFNLSFLTTLSSRSSPKKRIDSEIDEEKRCLGVFREIRASHEKFYSWKVAQNRQRSNFCLKHFSIKSISFDVEKSENGNSENSGFENFLRFSFLQQSTLVSWDFFEKPTPTEIIEEKRIPFKPDFPENYRSYSKNLIDKSFLNRRDKQLSQRSFFAQTNS